MASHTMPLTLFLCLNFVFFTLVTSNYVPTYPSLPPPSPKSPSYPGSPSTPTKPPPSPKSPSYPGGGPSTPTKPPPSPVKPTPPTPASPIIPVPATPPTKGDKCPINTLKLATCASVLNGLVDVVLGIPPKGQCCTLLDGLTNLDAALCLCTALKANILGINLNVPISLSVLLNFCNKAEIPGFQCP